jgi:hypothetical protein
MDVEFPEDEIRRGDNRAQSPSRADVLFLASAHPQIPRSLAPAPRTGGPFDPRADAPVLFVVRLETRDFVTAFVDPDRPRAALPKTIAIRLRPRSEV